MPLSIRLLNAVYDFQAAVATVAPIEQFLKLKHSFNQENCRDKTDLTVQKFDFTLCWAIPLPLQ